MIDEETKRKRAEEGQKAMHDDIAGARAVDEKTAKLRALRLAREAGESEERKSLRPSRRSAGRSIPVEELSAANDK